jgi:hypothetical protein
VHYRWEIKTGSTWYAGTNANVYLTLRGDKAAMQEVELNDPDSNDDWEKGDTNHGTIDTADLGNLQTGTLKHDGSGPSPDWTPEYVRITNDEDGRIWLAPVNTELKGNQVQRLVFKLEDKGQYEQLERSKKEAAEKARREADEASSKAEEEEAARLAEEEDRKARLALAAEKRKIDMDLRRAKNEAELAKARAEIDKLKAGAAAGAAGAGMPAGFRTIELFGQMNGQNVPLSQVLSEQGGGFVVVAGGAVLGGESAGEGFGYGGTPGRWAEASGGQPPTAFGQDATMGIVGFDGARAWPVPASTLAQIFGANWRGSLS